MNQREYKHPVLSKVLFLYILLSYLLTSFSVYEKVQSNNSSLAILVISCLALASFAFAFSVATLFNRYGGLRSIYLAMLFATVFYLLYLLD